MNKKAILFTFLILQSAVVCLAQSKESRKLSHFNKIKVGEGIELYLEHGSSESCEIEAHGINLNEIITDVSGSRLRIELDNNRNHRNIDVVIHLTYQELNSIYINSAAKVVSRGTIKSDEMEIDVNSAGSGNLEIETGDLSIDISSAAHLTLSGFAHIVDIDVSSAGKLNSKDLKCKEVTVYASSAGTAHIQADEKIIAKASSGGHVNYSGNPSKVNVNSSSGGSIRKGN